MTDNDYYAITLFDNEGKLKHVFIDIKIRVKYPPKDIDNVTINVTNYQTVGAMVDTGATICAISSRMVKIMKLKSYKEQKFHYAKGSNISPIYVFDVIFPKDKLFKNIDAVEIDDSHDCDFLIGMNILSQGDMALTWVDGKMAFSFRTPPAEKYIDFEYELMKAKHPNKDFSSTI